MRKRWRGKTHSRSQELRIACRSRLFRREERFENLSASFPSKAERVRSLTDVVSERVKQQRRSVRSKTLSDDGDLLWRRRAVDDLKERRSRVSSSSKDSAGRREEAHLLSSPRSILVTSDGSKVRSDSFEKHELESRRALLEDLLDDGVSDVCASEEQCRG